jgi:microcompartment protein CcmL/EutN
MDDAHRLTMTTGLVIEPALALLELDSIAAGIATGDAMAKRAPIDVLRAGTVHPGKYLVLVGGTVGDVEEALAAGREVGASSILDVVFLPNAHPELIAAIGGTCRDAAGEALGVIETATVAAIIEAADAGLKGARVRLVELRLADDLGGKGYLLFDGPVGEVEAAVEIGTLRIAGAQGLASRVIPQLHAEMSANLSEDGQFRARVRTDAAPAEKPAATPSRTPATATRRRGR